MNNFIHTSKYTTSDFLPKCFFMQFTNLPNLYFLVIAILESIPIISANYNAVAAWIPLIIVIGVSMLREFVEDKQRQKSDNEVNSTLCSAYRAGKWEKITWGQI
jgi:phospholipid-transporting ATPase